MISNVWYLIGLAVCCLVCAFAAYWTGWSNGRRINRDIERAMRLHILETCDYLEDAYDENEMLWDEIEALRDHAADTTASENFYRLTMSEQHAFRAMLRGERKTK
jgi:hypothetical protein